MRSGSGGCRRRSRRCRTLWFPGDLPKSGDDRTCAPLLSTRGTVVATRSGPVAPGGQVHLGRSPNRVRHLDSRSHTGLCPVTGGCNAPVHVCRFGLTEGEMSLLLGIARLAVFAALPLGWLGDHKGRRRPFLWSLTIVIIGGTLADSPLRHGSSGLKFSSGRLSPSDCVKKLIKNIPY